MRRLRPDDDYFIRLETDETPHHIGALQLFDLGGASREIEELQRISERDWITGAGAVLRKKQQDFANKRIARSKFKNIL